METKTRDIGLGRRLSTNICKVSICKSPKFDIIYLSKSSCFLWILWIGCRSECDSIWTHNLNAQFMRSLAFKITLKNGGNAEVLCKHCNSENKKGTKSSQVPPLSRIQLIHRLTLPRLRSLLMTKSRLMTTTFPFQKILAIFVSHFVSQLLFPKWSIVLIISQTYGMYEILKVKLFFGWN